MSYILDALKRADAERQRGAVPGLHVQQVGKSLGYASRGTSSRGRWLAVLAGVLMAAAVAYLYLSKLDVAPVSAVSTAPSPAATVAPVTLSASAPEVIAPHVVQPVAEPPAERQAPPAPKAKPVAPIGAEPVKAAPKIEAAVSTVQSPPPEIPKLSELPEEVRRQIPTLAINGSVYSDNPAQRMLVVNNLVQTQGSQIAPDLRLEEIGAKSSVFSFAGTRFRIAH